MTDQDDAFLSGRLLPFSGRTKTIHLPDLRAGEVVTLIELRTPCRGIWCGGVGTITTGVSNVGMDTIEAGPEIDTYIRRRYGQLQSGWRQTEETRESRQAHNAPGANNKKEER